MRLAPFYDLICTRAIDHIDFHLALDVGGERNPAMITPACWDMLAKQCDVQPQYLHNLVKETETALQERLGPVQEDFKARYSPYPALLHVEVIINQQHRHIVRQWKDFR